MGIASSTVPSTCRAGVPIVWSVASTSPWQVRQSLSCGCGNAGGSSWHAVQAVAWPLVSIQDGAATAPPPLAWQYVLLQVPSA